MAKWERKSNEFGPHGEARFQCSTCGEDSISEYLLDYSAFLTPYCPWCGAEMENWVEEQDKVDEEDQALYEAHKLEFKKKINDAFSRVEGASHDPHV